ncbi:class I SAM-dependent methyltransferase [Tepidibacillus marianensis]|uniref:class I SAM-dependent methyltransferase n=1 Tax=Tepidibacillus marianensis TaxID=3131995 RepID=UPI0030CBF47A
MFELDHELIIVERKHIKYYTAQDQQPFFFHPSMAILRINQLQKGDNDILVSLSKLKPDDSFLDCTLGLGSDSIVASYLVGERGRVVGVESQPVIAVIVEQGLQNGWKENHDIELAMKRIEVVTMNHLDYLYSLPDRSFDVIYFDPMFRQGFSKSSSMIPLRQVANSNSLAVETILQAKRIAKRAIVLKENKKVRNLNDWVSNQFVVLLLLPMG